MPIVSEESVDPSLGDEVVLEVDVFMVITFVAVVRRRGSSASDRSEYEHVVTIGEDRAPAVQDADVAPVDHHPQRRMSAGSTGAVRCAATAPP